MNRYQIQTANRGKNSHLKIEDSRSNDYFSIILWDAFWTEHIQLLSGMEGKYKTEYQCHMWTLVLRTSTDYQILDINIPLGFANYKQDVSSASVDFHLNDVERELNEIKKEAEKLSKEILNSDFGKYLSNIFNIKEAMVVPMSNIHAHPGQGLNLNSDIGRESVIFKDKDNQWKKATKTGVSGFSGTDYRSNPNDPGICFPLSEGRGQPIFSLIMQHRENVAEVIHAEGRIFNKEKNSLEYIKGVTAFIQKGIEWISPEPPAQKEPTWLNTMFEVEPFQPKVEEPRLYPDVIITDGTTPQEWMKELIEEWKKIDYDPIWNIEKNRVITERIPSFKRRGKVTVGGSQSLFGNDGYYMDDYDDYSYLYPKNQNNFKSTSDKMRELRKELEESYQIPYSETITLTYKELKAMKEKLDEEFGNNIGDDLIENMREILMNDNFISKEKNKMMSDDDIKDMFDDIYGDVV